MRLVLLAAAVCSFPFSVARAADRIGELKAHFSQEANPVRKAKLLAKLGDAQLLEMHRAIEAEDYAQALRILGAYRDEVKTAEAALKSTEVDAERKPAGFKQLEIHLRRCLRELDQTILALPEEQRAAFQNIREELANIQKELFDLLFPRQPGKNQSQNQPKG